MLTSVIALQRLELDLSLDLTLQPCYLAAKQGWLTDAVLAMACATQSSNLPAMADGRTEDGALRHCGEQKLKTYTGATPGNHFYLVVAAAASLRSTLTS
jgi:hypothetical protein